jgi:desumoylating isopeptidase 1
MDKDPVQKHYPVSVYLYDISEGFAKYLSPLFMGKFIEAIWHSSIVVYEMEVYMDGEIERSNVKQTPYGVPVKVLDLGKTSIPPVVFNSFLKTLEKRFCSDRYNLFKNNCNHFTEECVKFLTGRNLPKEIVELPSEILSTKFGRMVKYIKEKLEKKSPKRGEKISFDCDYLLENPEVVCEITELRDFIDVVENEKAAFIYVYRQNFKFYKVICSLIEIMEEHAHTRYSSIRFCTIDVERINFKLNNIVEFKEEPLFLLYLNRKLDQVLETKDKLLITEKLEELLKKIYISLTI